MICVRTRGCETAQAGSRQLRSFAGVCVILCFELLPLPSEASRPDKIKATGACHELKGEGGASMKTKSLLLSLPLTLSALMLASFPANAACWAFPQSPCPDTTGSAPTTESTVTPGATGTKEATAAPTPGAASEKPARAKKSETTAKVKPPAPAPALAKTNPALVPTETTVTPPEAPAQTKAAPQPSTMPVRAKAAPPAGPARFRDGRPRARVLRALGGSARRDA